MTRAGRLTGCVLVLTCLMTTRPVMAQGYPPLPAPYSPGGTVPAGMMPGGMMPGGMMPGGMVPGGMMPAGGMPGGMMPAGGLPPAAWQPQLAPIYTPEMPPCPPGYAGYGQGVAAGRDSGAVQHAGFFQDSGADYWDEPSPLETLVSHYLRNGFVRVDYLIWDVHNPGDTRLGAPMATVADPSRPFPVFDQQITPTQIGTAFVPTLHDINLHNNNGVRATWGLPLADGDFEFSAFWLAEAVGNYQAPTLRAQQEIFNPATSTLLTIDPGFFAATSLYNNGQPSDTVLLYNQNFLARFTSQIWGANAIYIGDAWPFSVPIRSELFSLRPEIGFDYFSVDEKLQQIGVYRDPTIPFPQSLDPNTYLVSRINSSADNNIYGALFGMRGEYAHKWFTLGVEPQLTLGGNNYDGMVSTLRLRGAADQPRTTTDGRWGFGGLLRLNTYAKLHLHERFSLFAGYNLIYVLGVSRPDENIYYNSTGPLGSAPPGVVIRSSFENLFINGGQFGGEYRF